MMNNGQMFYSPRMNEFSFVSNGIVFPVSNDYLSDLNFIAKNDVYVHSELPYKNMFGQSMYVTKKVHSKVDENESSTNSKSSEVMETGSNHNNYPYGNNFMYNQMMNHPFFNRNIQKCNNCCNHHNQNESKQQNVIQFIPEKVKQEEKQEMKIPKIIIEIRKPSPQKKPQKIVMEKLQEIPKYVPKGSPKPVKYDPDSIKHKIQTEPIYNR